MKRPIAYDPRADVMRLTAGPRPYRDPRGRDPSLPEIAAVAIGAALIVLMLF